MRTSSRSWAAALLLLAACGDAGSEEAAPTSGVEGHVLLGPQCPVEVEGEPCEDEPAADVEVTVHEQNPGESYTAGAVVASTRTDADGRYRVAVEPGEYVVTAEAGMFCELMDVRVVDGEFATMDVPCDTGIR